MKTKEDITYKALPYSRVVAVIPAGTKVVPADNLPEKDLFWCERWPGMTEEAQSWHRNYGFLVELHEVKEEEK